MDYDDIEETQTRIMSVGRGAICVVGILYNKYRSYITHASYKLVNRIVVYQVECN